MEKDTSKPADKRAGTDRRQRQDPGFAGPERRVGDRRAKQEPNAD